MEDPLCGGLAEDGFCDEGVARWCDLAKGPQEWNCPEYSLKCSMTTNGVYCIADETIETEPTAECETLGFRGVCEGNVARYCVGENTDILVQNDCIETGETCQVDTCFEGAGCCPEIDPADEAECLRLGFEGECAGNVARYCDDGEIIEEDCDDYDDDTVVCLMDPDVGAVCEEEEVEDECGGITEDGMCEDLSTLQFCWDGTLEEVTCGTEATCVEDLCITGEASCCTNEEICATMPADGLCLGPDYNHAFYCIDNYLFKDDCDLEGTNCIIDADYGALCDV